MYCVFSLCLEAEVTFSYERQRIDVKYTKRGPSLISSSVSETIKDLLTYRWVFCHEALSFLHRSSNRC